MAVLHKSIRLRPDEHDLLRERYLAKRIPIDQYEKRPGDLASFIAEWNRLSERNDSESDVIHYMRTQRKQKKWPKLDGGHERYLGSPGDAMDEGQLSHLKGIYADLCIARGLGSDCLSHDEVLAKEFSDEFAMRTGLMRDGRYLMTLLMQERKRKRLAKVRDNGPRPPSIGFGDLDEIVS